MAYETAENDPQSSVAVRGATRKTSVGFATEVVIDVSKHTASFEVTKAPASCKTTKDPLSLPAHLLFLLDVPTESIKWSGGRYRGGQRTWFGAACYITKLRRA